MNENPIEIEMRDKCKSICSLMQLRIVFKKVQQHISIAMRMLKLKSTYTFFWIAGNENCYNVIYFLIVLIFGTQIKI